MVFYLRAHKPCCPSFPLPSPSQLSPSVIILPLFPLSLPHVFGQAFSSLQGGGLPHHVCANWGLMRGICFPLCADGSPAGALAGSALSVCLGCSRRTADAPWSPTESSWLLSLPCHEPACASCHTARAPGVLYHHPAPQEELHAAKSSFSLTEKTKPVVSWSQYLKQEPPRTDSISIEKCTQISAKIAVKMCRFVFFFSF